MKKFFNKIKNWFIVMWYNYKLKKYLSESTSLFPEITSEEIKYCYKVLGDIRVERRNENIKKRNKKLEKIIFDSNTKKLSDVQSETDSLMMNYLFLKSDNSLQDESFYRECGYNLENVGSLYGNDFGVLVELCVLSEQHKQLGIKRVKTGLVDLE